MPMLTPFVFRGYNASFTSVPSPCHAECLSEWCWCHGSCPKRPSKKSLIHFYKRCVSVPMLISYVFRVCNAPFTSVPSPCHVECLLVWCWRHGFIASFTTVFNPCHAECLSKWCWCHGTCPKRPSSNSLIHFYKRCVSVYMLTPIVFRGSNAPITSAPSPCHVECLSEWCWCHGSRPKRPSNKSLIHFYKRCVSVSMIISCVFRVYNAPFTSVPSPYHVK